jgi:hypothetical protein
MKSNLTSLETIRTRTDKILNESVVRRRKSSSRIFFYLVVFFVLFSNVCSSTPTIGNVTVDTLIDANSKGFLCLSLPVTITWQSSSFPSGAYVSLSLIDTSAPTATFYTISSRFMNPPNVAFVTYTWFSPPLSSAPAALRTAVSAGTTKSYEIHVASPGAVNATSVAAFYFTSTLQPSANDFVGRSLSSPSLLTFPRAGNGSYSPIFPNGIETVDVFDNVFNTATRGFEAQSIYQASWLSGAGLVPGSPITSVALKILVPPGASTGVGNVRVAGALTSFSFISSSMLPVSVLYGPNNLPLSDFVADSWLEFPFTTPLLWDGASSIVFDFSALSSDYAPGGQVAMMAPQNNPTTQQYTQATSADNFFAFPYTATGGQLQPAMIELTVRTACSGSAGGGTVCSGKGSCSSSGVCVCNAGYYGLNCQTACNAATTCFGNGACSVLDGSCVCSAGFFGPQCTFAGADPLLSNAALLYAFDPLNLQENINGNFSHLQFLFTETDLLAAGLTIGQSISALLIPLSALPEIPVPNFSISILLSSTFSSYASTSYAFLPESEFTLIFNGTLPLNDAQLFYERYYLSPASGGFAAEYDSFLSIGLHGAVPAWNGDTVVVDMFAEASPALVTFTAGSLDWQRVNSGDRSLVQTDAMSAAASLWSQPRVVFGSYAAAAPSVTSVTPTTVPASGAVTLTITGVRLGAQQSDVFAVLVVAQDGTVTPCQTPVWSSSTQLTCTAPSLPANTNFTIETAYEVRVLTLLSGISNPSNAGQPVAGATLTWSPVPVLFKISPDHAFVDGQLTARITAQFLPESVTNIASISLGIGSCTTPVIQGNALVCNISAATLPANPGLQMSFASTVAITLTDGGVSSGGVIFTYNRYVTVSINGATGSDTLCAASLTSPCQTIGGALSVYPYAFTTFLVSAGTYHESGLRFGATGQRLLGAGSGQTVVDCQWLAPCFLPAFGSGQPLSSAAGTATALSSFTPAVVSGVTLVNGLANGGSGGGVFSWSDAPLAPASPADIPLTLTLLGGVLTVQDVVFASSMASSGPAVLLQCTQANATDCALAQLNGVNFFNNGNVSAATGALTVVRCQVTLRSCEFGSNVAATGAALSISASSTVTLHNVSFHGNMASTRGGAVYVAASTLTLANCPLSSNEAFLAGGAISAQQATLTISNSIFIDNQVDGRLSSALAGYHTPFYTAQSRHLRAYALVRLTPLLHFHSQAAQSEAGVLSLAGGGGLNRAATAVIPTSATLSGGAVDAVVSSLLFTSVSFSGNAVVTDLGVLGGAGGAVHGVFCQATLTNVGFAGNSAAQGGAAAFDTQSSVTLSTTQWSANTASSAATGGATPAYGGALLMTNGLALAVSNASFTANVADFGGAVAIDSSLAVVLNTPLTFTGNVAQQGGGALFLSTVAATLSAAVFANNAAEDGGGGAILYDPASATGIAFTALTLSNNSATYGANFATTPYALLVFINASASSAATPDGAVSPYTVLNSSNVLQGASGIALSRTLLVQELDALNATVLSDSSSLVEGVSPGGSVGTALRPLTLGEAVFSDFGIIGTPGTVTSFVFQVTTSKGVVQSAPVQVQLRQCAVGEGFNGRQCALCTGPTYQPLAGQLSCKACDPGAAADVTGTTCFCNGGRRDGLPPPCFENPNLDDGERAGIIVAGAITLLLSFGAMAVVGKFVDHRVIFSSSPLFLALFCLGILLVSLSVILHAQVLNTGTCTAHVFFLNIGFMLTYGALLVKTYRLHKIFNNPFIRVVAILNRDLLIRLAILVAFDLVVMFCWVGIDPYALNSEEDPYCRSANQNVYLGILSASKGALLLYGSWLTYKVRGLPSSFNESRYIGVSIYIITLLSLAWLAINYGLNLQYSSVILAEELLEILGSFTVLALLFVPKLLLIRSDAGKKSFFTTASKPRSRLAPTSPRSGKSTLQPAKSLKYAGSQLALSTSPTAAAAAAAAASGHQRSGLSSSVINSTALQIQRHESEHAGKTREELEARSESLKRAYVNLHQDFERQIRGLKKQEHKLTHQVRQVEEMCVVLGDVTAEIEYFRSLTGRGPALNISEVVNEYYGLHKELRSELHYDLQAMGITSSFGTTKSKEMVFDPSEGKTRTANDDLPGGMTEEQEKEESRKNPSRNSKRKSEKRNAV